MADNLGKICIRELGIEDIEYVMSGMDNKGLV